jgi:transcriptional regulator with XRE-family HTH domain
MEGLRIKEVLSEKGYTQKKLSELTGIAEISLSRSINGNPTFETLQKIASALNVPITDLFERPKQNIITCPKCGTALEIKEKESYNVDEDPLLQ